MALVAVPTTVENREEWIDIQEGICCTLAEVRGQPEFAAHIEFGQWCLANGFDKIDPHDRAAAIHMGGQPAALRACLLATHRRPLRRIYEKDFPRFGQMPITKVRRGKPNKTKVEEVAEHIRPKIEAGEAVSRAKVADEMGVGERVVEIARERELGRLQGLAERPPMTKAEMSKTAAQRYEAALKKARLEIREELKAEVYAELEVFRKHWQERIEWAERIENNWNGVISREAFRLIRNCLHPDHNTFRGAGEAFRVFCDLEKVLVKPEQKPMPEGAAPYLPSTVAELMAMRRTRRR